jgi:hypothetical protein
MTNSDLLGEIEDDIEMVDVDRRSADLSLTGSGDEVSEPIESPGGMAIFDCTFADRGRYKIKAVGQTAEDNVVKTADRGTPIEHRILTNLDEGTYMLNVSAQEGAAWSLDVYFSSPEPTTLPIMKSGRGDDFIGPLSHKGFISVSVTNFHSKRLRIKQPKTNGKRYMNSPGFGVDASSDDLGESKQEVMSTKDGYTDYPWVYVQCDGEWEVEVEVP